jgi:uncharacterized repeat protein (TIGR03803 family)
MNIQQGQRMGRTERLFAGRAMVLLAAMAHLGLALAQVPTATETVLYSFTNGADGAFPNDLVAGTDGNFYGVTSNTMFRITPAGALTTLYTFCGSPSLCPNGKPTPAGLTLLPGNIMVPGDIFYGLDASSSGPGAPAFFDITATGTYTKLLSLSGTDGNPAGSAPGSGAKLVLGTDGNFYGADAGPTDTSGSIFRITPGGEFTTLYTFSPTTGGINSDGATPYSRLMQASDGNFYGTTYTGGAYGGGTVYRITPAGVLTSLYSFGTVGGVGDSNVDGRNPFAGLIEGSDGNLYGGTPNGGGVHDLGTLYRITLGGELTTLHQFNPTTNLTLSFAASPSAITLGQFANLTWSLAGTIASEGGGPKQTLLLGKDGNFYGFGGEVSSGSDSVFQMTPAGIFTTILPPPSGETEPDSLLQTSDGTFYGTNYYGGGAGNYGSVFELTLGTSPVPTPCTPGISPASGGGTFGGALAANGNLAVTPTATGTYYYSLTCSFPGNEDTPTVGPLYAMLTVNGPELPAYGAGELSIPLVGIGNASFDSMVVTLGRIVSGPNGSSPTGSEVTYVPASNQMTIPAVTVGSTTYDNVVITVGSLLSVGAVTGADFYNGATISIPSVQVLGGSAYHDVVITLGSIISAGGGMPTSVRDVYNPATKELTIEAIEVGGKVYTNPVITVGSIVSVGGLGP